MSASSSFASMRRGFKPMMLALGAATAIPAVMLIADQNLDHSGNIDVQKHRRAKYELMKEDARGFLQTAADRFFSLGKLGSREGTRTTEGTTTTADTTTATTTATASGLQIEALEDRLDFKRLGLDPPTAILAQEFSAQVAQIRKDAEQLINDDDDGLKETISLPSRFTNEEVMRYAIHHGYLRARDDASRKRALHHAALAAAETAEWIRAYPFASDDALQRFSHLVWWTQPTPETRPTLHVDIGRAVHECRGPDAVAFANAVITLIERAVQHRLKNAPEGHDRVDVVVYAAGTSAFSASRAARVLRSVVTTLSHHYPGRLHQLTLLDLPRVLTWLVKGAKKLVHKETARKVLSATSDAWQPSVVRRVVPLDDDDDDLDQEGLDK